MHAGGTGTRLVTKSWRKNLHLNSGAYGARSAVTWHWGEEDGSSVDRVRMHKPTHNVSPPRKYSKVNMRVKSKLNYCDSTVPNINKESKFSTTLPVKAKRSPSHTIFKSTLKVTLQWFWLQPVTKHFSLHIWLNQQYPLNMVKGMFMSQNVWMASENVCWRCKIELKLADLLSFTGPLICKSKS